MKHILFLLSALLITQIVIGQQTADVNGQVTDSINKPVKDATVSIRSSTDSLKILTVITDSSGRFLIQNIQPGNYNILITCIGYQKYMSNILTLQNGKFELDRIILHHDRNIYLKEVTVTSGKKFIEHKIDRTIINVDALATNTGTTAMEILEKSPGILVDPNGGISFEGKQGVVVYIDDKKSYLTGSDLAAYLQSLPSSALDQIELMTNPPAKYEASGSGGVINIKLKRNKVKGFNGGATLIFGHWRYSKTEARFNFNYRYNKINVFGNFGDNMQNYGIREYYNRHYLNPDRSSKGDFIQQKISHGKGNTFRPQLGLDFYQNEKTTWGIFFSGIQKPFNLKSETITQLSDANNQPDSSVNQNLDENSNFRTLRTNLNYRHWYALKGHELSADFDYNIFSVSDDQFFENLTQIPGQSTQKTSGQSGFNPSTIKILAFKTDYTRPFKNGLKLESGIKWSYAKTDNLADYFNIVNNVTNPDFDKSNHFIYTENINAAYFTVNKEWKKLSIELGLRLENTAISGHQLGNQVRSDSAFKRNYISLFPTVYLQYRLDSADINQFGLTYGRRINRPYYQDLDPFITPIDNYTYNVGNPYLKPSYSQNIELSHTYKNNLTTKLSYNKSTSDIKQSNTVINGIYYSRPANLGSYVTKSISVSGSINPVKWFTFRGFGSLNFFHSQIRLNTGTVDTYGNNVFINGNCQFSFPKGWNTELNGFFNSKFNSYQVTENAFWRMNLVIQKKLFANTTVKLTVTDIFKSFNFKGTINNLQLTEATYRTIYDTRGFNINITQRFGKSIKGLRRHDANASDNEQGRVKTDSKN